VASVAICGDVTRLHQGLPEEVNHKSDRGFNSIPCANVHPAHAPRQYRDEFVGNAKAVVVGMTSNGFTLADPKCLRTATSGMLDVVGFDTSVPAVISDFVRAA